MPDMIEKLARAIAGRHVYGNDADCIVDEEWREHVPFARFIIEVMAEPTEKVSATGAWRVVDNSWDVSTIYGPNGEEVARCEISTEATEETQDEFEREKEARARLIADAPDLRAALTELHDTVCRATDGHSWPDYLWVAVLRTRDLIREKK